MGADAEMTCRGLVELLTDYLEGVLGPDQTARLEEHLERCPYCAEYVAQMRRTIDSLGHVRAESLAPGTRDALLVAFRDWR